MFNPRSELENLPEDSSRILEEEWDREWEAYDRWIWDGPEAGVADPYASIETPWDILDAGRDLSQPDWDGCYPE